jgi:hypothetical protein
MAGRCDGEFDRCELRLAGGVVRVRLAVPRLGCLQQDFALPACNIIRAWLRECERKRCYGDGGGTDGAVLRNHIDYLPVG